MFHACILVSQVEPYLKKREIYISFNPVFLKTMQEEEDVKELLATQVGNINMNSE